MSRSFSLPALPVVLALLVAGPAAAATFTVMNLADSGPGSLRQTVLDANAAAGADEVTFAPGLSGTITLTTDQIAITDPLVVSGPGIGVLTISGNDLFRIFLVEKPAVEAPIDVTLSGLTLTHGRGLPAVPSGDGGAVFALGENLTIADSVVSDSQAATYGGGIAIYSLFSAELTIESSTISGNSTANFGFGGGISAQFTTVHILNSTISGNAAGQGGGILMDSSFLEILNSTLTGNHAQRFGGAIGGNGVFRLRLTTVTQNTAGKAGGSLAFETLFPGSDVELDHSILANGEPEDLNSGPLPGGLTAHYSLIEAPGNVFVGGAHNLIGADPHLGPLADNGGPTPTHALLPGSPARDAGNPSISGPPATDQRGSVRILGPSIDLGSVEGGTFVEVPTLSQVGLFLLVASLLVAGAIRLRRHVATRPVA